MKVLNLRVFGIRMGTNIYMGLTLLGQLSFSSGVWCGSYWLMLFGRFIFGYVHHFLHEKI